MYEHHRFHLTSDQASGLFTGSECEANVPFNINTEHKALKLFYSVLYLVQGK